MFYAESQHPVNGDINIAEIRGDRVFTHCSKCDEEV